MLRDEQDSGLSALLFGERWQTGAWRAAALFILAYVLPSLLLAPGNRAAAFLRLFATALVFVLTTGAIYKFLQSRQDEEWVEDEELAHEKPMQVAAAAASPAPASQAAPSVALESLGQAALERLCIALYQFNGLSSQTVAVGVEGAYRIRLFPRNEDKPLALLLCSAGTEPQGVSAYTVLLRAMEEDALGKAFFVAPAGFTEPVVADARSRHVTLVDLKLLRAMIDRLPDAAARAGVLDAATA